jgi:hypothetical protein
VAEARRKGAAAGYFAASRSLAASFVFVTPLLALYEVALAADEGVRTGAVSLVHELFAPVGHWGLLALNLLLLGFLCLAIWWTRARRRRVPGMYGLMFLESCAWSAFMLAVASLVPRSLALPPVPRELLGYVGAGIYEEFLFRFLLLNGLVLVLHRGLGADPVWIVPAAVVASAILFSWAHHALGGEPYVQGVFLYRALMGVILGAAFCLRGLGIVVYAHAIYNVALALLKHVGS